MHTWKEAFRIAIFEMRTQIGYSLLGWLLVIFVGGMFLSSFYSYLERPALFFDLIFIIYFVFFPFWTRPKRLQSQKITGSFWAAPFFVFQQQLSIPTRIMIRGRILAYVLYLLPGISITFAAVYLFDPRMQATVDIATYVIFLGLWFAIGMTIGLSLTAAEIGEELNFQAMLTFRYLTFFLPGLSLFAAIIYFTYDVMQSGIVASTVHVAQHYPWQTLLGSAFLVYISLLFWQNYMEKKAAKTDYF